MFDDFFKCWDELPADGGFTLFGIVHIGWLIFIAAAICLLVYYFRKLPDEEKIKRLRLLSVITLGLEILKDIFLIVKGNMAFSYLPLEMCGLAIFVELFYAFTGKKFFGEIMCIICMPGAFAALLFPDWTGYPLLNFIHINSFILHGMLVTVPVIAVLSGMYMPKIRNIYKVYLFLIITVPVIYLINKWQGTNFMFLSYPSNGSPFYGIYEKWGYTTYMIIYALVVIVCIFIMYAIYGAIEKYKTQTPQNPTHSI